MKKFITFETPVKIIYLILNISFLANATQYIISKFDFFNAVIVNTYTLFEGALLIYYFYKMGEKKFFPIALTIFLSAFVIELSQIAETSKFLEISVVIESVILILFTLRFFLRTLGELKVGHLVEYPYFWINCGILIYFAGCIFIFAFDNLIQENGIHVLWHLHNFFHVVFMILIGVAFWKVRSTKI